ncbi:MAG: group I intron-associated PD-(D/E)XK endonuclease [Arachnia sp.]
MGRAKTYSDEQLRNAVAVSSSWRGVLRELGLASASGAAMRSARLHAVRLGVDTDHFRGQRRWTEDQLRSAVAAGASWPEVADRLELRGGTAVSSLRGHAARLGLDVAHLESRVPGVEVVDRRPDAVHVARAASLIAAAWFSLCGDTVTWPLEPCRYDLLVDRGGELRRVQVKSTAARGGGPRTVYLSTTRRTRRTYDPSEVDDFFIVDGSLRLYLIPLAAVGGLHAISLGAYERFRLHGLG